jgi:hypothetical protein
MDLYEVLGLSDSDDEGGGRAPVQAKRRRADRATPASQPRVPAPTAERGEDDGDGDGDGDDEDEDEDGPKPWRHVVEDGAPKAAQWARRAALVPF